MLRAYRETCRGRASNPPTLQCGCGKRFDRSPVSMNAQRPSTGPPVTASASLRLFSGRRLYHASRVCLPREGGFETRPYKSPNLCAASGRDVPAADSCGAVRTKISFGSATARCDEQGVIYDAAWLQALEAAQVQFLKNMPPRHQQSGTFTTPL